MNDNYQNKKDAVKILAKDIIEADKSISFKLNNQNFNGNFYQKNKVVYMLSGFNKKELYLLNYICSYINKKTSSDAYITISLKDIMCFLAQKDHPSGRDYKNIDKLVKEVRSWNLVATDLPSTAITYISIFDKVRVTNGDYAISDERNCISFHFSPDAYPFFIDLKDGDFFKSKVSDIRKINSNTGIKLYEIIIATLKNHEKVSITHTVSEWDSYFYIKYDQIDLKNVSDLIRDLKRAIRAIQKAFPNQFKMQIRKHRNGIN